jgi:phage tail-like protein
MTAAAATTQASSLLNYLPAIYHQDPFIGSFLLAFEEVLLGLDDGQGEPGLEQTIAGISTLFDPALTPEKFLPWLADWTAFTLRADLNPNQQRAFLANIVQLYRWRGTKRNLQDLLKIFTIGSPIITEPDADEFQIGVHSTIGLDTYLAGGAPFFFTVTISLPRTDPTTQQRQLEIAGAIIELEKPAHTFYQLTPVFPSIQIGVNSTVGVDTLVAE